MTIQQILKSWGIDVPDSNSNLYIPEYLVQKYRSKCYLVDYFPKTIRQEHAYKYNQIESEVYNYLYDRMYNALLKIWMYDKLFFESELLNSKPSFLNRFSLDFIKKRKLRKTMNTTYVDTKEHLKLLVQLSKNNSIDLSLLFEEFHVVLVPSWSTFFMFIENDTVLPFIRDVFMTEGLYVRNYSDD